MRRLPTIKIIFVNCIAIRATKTVVFNSINSTGYLQILPLALSCDDRDLMSNSVGAVMCVVEYGIHKAI